MAWDSSRPVPWGRLLREWLIYTAIMGVVFLLFFRGSGLVGATVGLLVSGPLYLALGWVLAKLGYGRTRLLVRGRSTRRADDAVTPAPSTPTEQRARPAPTRRTAGSAAQRPRAARKRR
jgi:hypothetical protein